jgi:hypothetical protein
MAGHQVHAGVVSSAVSLTGEPIACRRKEFEAQQFLPVDRLTDKHCLLHKKLSSLLGELAAQVVVAIMAK